VPPRTRVNGVPVNDDPHLEHEADVMGARASGASPPARPAGVPRRPLPRRHRPPWCSASPSGAMSSRSTGQDRNPRS
jgi:hypothetical protein